MKRPKWHFLAPLLAVSVNFGARVGISLDPIPPAMRDVESEPEGRTADRGRQILMSPPLTQDLARQDLPFLGRAGEEQSLAEPHVEPRIEPLTDPLTEPLTPDVRPSLAPTLPGTTLTADDFFNNACQPPLLRTVHVPKTKPELERQLGSSFRVVRRGAFLLAGDLEEEAFRQLVDGVFMCCLACLQHDYFKKPVIQTVTIYIFRDSESYRDGLQSHFHMNPISPYGHYGHRQRYIVVNYETGPGTLVHELTHALMAVDFPDAPIWISEGIASLYEQCRVEGDSLKGEPNWRLPELQEALKEGTLPPLRNLLSMDFRAFRERNESLHYAQSRYFCKFMESRGLLRPLYAAFRDSHASDPTGVINVERIFGQSLEEVEAEWHAWLQTRVWHPPTAMQRN